MLYRFSKHAIRENYSLNAFHYSLYHYLARKRKNKDEFSPPSSDNLLLVEQSVVEIIFSLTCIFDEMLMDASFSAHTTVF